MPTNLIFGRWAIVRNIPTITVLMCSDFQFRDPLSDDDIVTTLGTIVDGANILNAEKLNPMKRLSHYFSGPPAPGVLHLVIQVPPPGKYQPLTPSCQRD